MCLCLYIQKNHWATLCINEDGKICLYDSFNTSVSEDTLKTMSKLLYGQEKSFTVQIMNLYKQTGVSMAVATSLASNADPASVIFDQVDLRSHFRQCMETGKVKVARFPCDKEKKTCQLHSCY